MPEVQNQAQSAHLTAALRDLVAQARYREALAFFLQCHEAGLEPAPEGLLLGAHAALRIGEFGLCTSLARDAESAFVAAGDQVGVLECLNLLGAVAFEQGCMTEAEANFRRVMELAEAAGRSRDLARAANNLANIAHLRGQRDYANALYQKALGTYYGIEDARGIVETRHNLALANRVSLGLEASISACGRAIEAAERLGVGGLIALTLLGMAELLIERESFQEAQEHIDRAAHLAWMEGNEPHVLESERLRALLTLRRGCSSGAHERAELVRSRASQAGCALIAAEAASIAALALKVDRRTQEAQAAHALTVTSMQALGADGLLETHHRAWENTPA